MNCSYVIVHAPLIAALVEGRINPLVNGKSRPNSNNAIDVWTWHCYNDGRAGDLWARWYHAQSDRTRGQHRQVFDALEDRKDWGLPLTKNLSKGLIEVIVKSEVQWRIFGFYGPKGVRRAFTIVLIGNHMDKVYDPPDAIKQARKIMKDIENGKSTARPCTRPKEPEEL